MPSFGGGPGTLLIGGDIGGTIATPLVQSEHYLNTPFVDVMAYGAKGDGSTDDSAAIQSALNAASSFGTLATVGFPANRTFAIASQIVPSSANNCMIRGIGGKATIKYTGSAITSDGASGAMIDFSGTDHSFGGIADMFLDCNSLAAFGVYAEGNFNAGFLLRDLHIKNASLDLICCRKNGSLGPTLLVIERITGFATTTWSGITAVCGRFPINLDLNNSAGVVMIRDCTIDNGVSGFVGIEGATNAGDDIILDNFRFEVNASSIDGVVLNYAGAGVPNTLTLRNCKCVVSAGSMNAMIHNLSSGALRPTIQVEVYTPFNAPTYIYQDANDSTKNVTHDSTRSFTYMTLNQTSAVGQFPIGTAMASTPRAGEYSYDDNNNALIHYSSNRAATMYTQLGASMPNGPSSTPYAVVTSDNGKMIHNNNASGGTLEVDLPAASSTPNGFTVTATCLQAGVITIKPNGTNKIRGSNTNLVSNNAANQTVVLKLFPGSNWQLVSSVGTWT